MNEQVLEQQSEQMSFDAACLAFEVSDEALEAAGGGSGLGAVDIAVKTQSVWGHCIPWRFSA